MEHMWRFGNGEVLRLVFLGESGVKQASLSTGSLVSQFSSGFVQNRHGHVDSRFDPRITRSAGCPQRAVCCITLWLATCSTLALLFRHFFLSTVYLLCCRLTMLLLPDTY